MAEQTQQTTTPATTQQPATQQPTQQQAPARTAVDQIEARRQAITANPDFFDKVKGVELRREMAAITSGQKYTPTPPDKREPTTAERFKKANDERTAATKKAEAEAKAALPKFERRRQELTRMLTERNAKLTDKERAGLTQELRELVASQMSAAEHEAILNEPVSQLRERFGLTNHLDRLLPAMRERWDSEAEAEVVASFVHGGASQHAAQTIMNWYVDTMNRYGGDIGNVDFDGLEGEFRTMATRAGLSKAHIDALVKYERERMVG
jgi:hypothetical protein